MKRSPAVGLVSLFSLTTPDQDGTERRDGLEGLLEHVVSPAQGFQSFAAQAFQCGIFGGLRGA